MLSIEISVGKLAVHLGVGPGHGKSDTSKHVVGGDPIDMVLVDLGANDNSVLILVFSPLPFARPLLANVLSPAGGFLVLRHLVEVNIGVDGPCGPADERHGPPATGG